LPAPVVSRLKEVSCILFDLDGTLTDTTELILTAFHETFRVLGLPQHSDEELLSRVGRPLLVQMRDIDPVKGKELAATYARLYESYHDELAREIPGIRESLVELKERGYRMAIVTSKRSSATHFDLDYFDLNPFVETVIAADDVNFHKPHPEPVLMALQRLGVSSRKATFIGDSPFDLRSAHDAGVLAGAVEWSPFPRDVLEKERPDYWIATPSDLVQVFTAPTGGLEHGMQA
jgi:pyrophosphatase PpaX